MQICPAIFNASSTISLAGRFEWASNALAAASGVWAAAADADDSIGWFDDVAGTADDQAHRLIGHGQHGFQAAKNPVGAPILGEFDHGAAGVIGMLGQFLFEAFEQGKRIRGRSGETGQDLAVPNSPDFDGIMFGDDLAERHLPIAPEGNLTIFANAEDCGRPSRFHVHAGL